MDVNDANASFAGNDDINSAQSILNPALVGGYVNQPNAGDSGRSFSTGDTVDSYRVDLRRNDQITLFMGADDLSRNDLDLILLQTNGVVVDAATNRSQAEVLYAPADGTYILQVQAFKGASAYVLSIGGGNQSQQVAGMRLSDAFMPGEITASFKPQQFSAQAISSLAYLGIQQVAGEADRRMLFSLNEAQQLSPHSVGHQPLQFADEQQQRKYATLMAIKALKDRLDVEHADPNYIFSTQAINPNDSLYRYQWHYPFINLPKAWEITTGSSNVVVAVIDTGVYLTHPDLQTKLVDGYDFIRSTSVALDGNGIDPSADDPGDSPGQASGSSFHGTHVAGTIGALTNNSDGVAGIGWRTRVMPLRVLGKGGNGTDYDIEQALRYAAGLSNDSGTVPSQRADIINLSLGGSSISSSFQGVVNLARRAGSMIVAAAGNDGNSTIMYPGGLDGVISVAAVNINRQRANYSNFNRTVDIAAPGGNNLDVNGDGVFDGVVSTMGDDSQGFRRAVFAPSFGTSMATPHIAGVLSLMKAANPNLTPAQVDNLISSGSITQDLGSSGKDNSYGYGLIDAYAAVQAALALSGSNTQEPAAQLGASPASLNFSLNTNALSLTLSNTGGGSLRLDRVTDSSGGRLTLTASSVDSNGLGTYTVNLNRSNLSAGTYTARLTFYSSVNSIEVPVYWQVSPATSSGDSGHQYVLLVNPDTLESVLEDQVKVVNGVYQYEFKNVPHGEYLLLSGSDNNNNQLVCDTAEACGAYPVLSRMQRLSIQRDISNLNFDVNFNTQFFSTASAQNGGETQAKGFRRPTTYKQLR